MQAERRGNSNHGDVCGISLAVGSVESRAACQINALTEAKKTPLRTLAIGRLVQAVGGAGRAETPRKTRFTLDAERNDPLPWLASMSFDSEDEEEQGNGLYGLSDGEGGGMRVHGG